MEQHSTIKNEGKCVEQVKEECVPLEFLRRVAQPIAVARILEAKLCLGGVFWPQSTSAVSEYTPHMP
jgi:hypothetical protein